MQDKFRLLIVNDNPITLEMMRNIVRHHRHLNTDVVVLAASALEKIQNNPPYHIIITDLTTPYFTGMDVLKAARAKSPDTRVLIVTTWGNHQGIIDAIKAGVYDYLQKPFRPEELNLKLINMTAHFRMVQDLIDQKTLFDEKELELDKLRSEQKSYLEEIDRLKKKLAHYQPEEDVIDLDTAIARIAAQKGSKLQSYNVYRKLTDLNQLLEEKKITSDEFQNLRKAVLDKAYQIPTHQD